MDRSEASITANGIIEKIISENKDINEVIDECDLSRLLPFVNVDHQELILTNFSKNKQYETMIFIAQNISYENPNLSGKISSILLGLEKQGAEINWYDRDEYLRDKFVSWAKVYEDSMGESQQPTLGLG